MTDFTTPDELTEDSSVQEAAEAAYYAARLSDSTYHGTDHTSASNVLVRWSKVVSDLSPAEAYTKGYSRFESLLEEQTA